LHPGQTRDALAVPRRRAHEGVDQLAHRISPNGHASNQVYPAVYAAIVTDPFRKLTFHIRCTLNRLAGEMLV
jgi:hypothetical protein